VAGPGDVSQVDNAAKDAAYDELMDSLRPHTRNSVLEDIDINPLGNTTTAEHKRNYWWALIPVFWILAAPLVLLGVAMMATLILALPGFALLMWGGALAALPIAKGVEHSQRRRWDFDEKPSGV
jgi:hypothetical protein